MTTIRIAAAAVATAALLACQQPSQQPPEREPIGFTDTPMLPGGKWHVHDIDRPHPPAVTPGATYGAAPSDAIVLFDGKDLSKWEQGGQWSQPGHGAPKWVVRDGYFEVTPHSGDLVTKEKFGDVQLHIEWASPAEVKGESQARGNSGVILMSRYEVQVLDSYNNVTYADGQAGAIYGQWPPLVNASRGPGEWQTYDIAFEAPRWDGKKLVKPAYFTVFHNGVLLHNHQEAIGAVVYRQLAKYSPHGSEEPLLLQDHNYPVRFRNIWVRRLKGYDQK